MSQDVRKAAVADQVLLVGINDLEAGTNGVPVDPGRPGAAGQLILASNPEVENFSRLPVSDVSFAFFWGPTDAQIHLHQHLYQIGRLDSCMNVSLTGYLTEVAHNMNSVDPAYFEASIYFEDPSGNMWRRSFGLLPRSLDASEWEKRSEIPRFLPHGDAPQPQRMPGCVAG